MRWLIGVAVALSTSCSSGRVCNPGDTRTCVGIGACTGGQACLADGTGYGTCGCGGAGGGSGVGGGTAGGGTAGGGTAGGGTAGGGTAGGGTAGGGTA